jgi:hypothetical protein
VPSACFNAQPLVFSALFNSHMGFDGSDNRIRSPPRAAVRIHAPVRTLNNNVVRHCQLGRHSYTDLLWVAGQRTYPKEHRAVLESPKEQTL